MTLTHRSIAVTAAALIVFGGASTAGAACSAPEMESAMQGVVDALNSRELDRLDAIAADGFVRRAPDQDADGAAGWKAMFSEILTAFPDFRIRADAVATGMDDGFIKWTTEATNSGDSVQPGTGNTIKVTGVSHFLFSKDCRVTHELVYFDTASMLAQLDTAAVPYADTKR